VCRRASARLTSLSSVASIQVGDVEQRKAKPRHKARTASQGRWLVDQKHGADDCHREDEDADAQNTDEANGVSRSDQEPSAEPSPGPMRGERHRGHHATLNEYRIVLAIMPFPAKPMDTYTGFERPGTVTLRTRIE